MYFCIGLLILKLIFTLNDVEAKVSLKYSSAPEKFSVFPLDSQLKPQLNSFLNPSVPKFLNNNSGDSMLNKDGDFDFWKICRETFYRGYEHVSVITLDNDFLEPQEVFANLGLVTWFTETNHLKTTTNVIIVVKSFDPFHKLIQAENLWYQKRIFVIVILECSADIKTEMETLWHFHKIYRYVLLCVYEKPSMYVYRPYLPDSRSKILEITDTGEIVHNVRHAVDNLYQLPLRVVLFPLIPFAIERDGRYVGGVDYNSLLVLHERMNFSPVILPPTDGNTYPQPNKKLSGSVKDLAAGIADIAFNGHFLQNYGIDEVEMTRYVYIDKLCFVVSIPSFKSHYTIIIHIFSKQIWILLFIVYFVTVIVYYMTRKFNGCRECEVRIIDVFLPTYSILVLGSSTLKVPRLSQKFLIGAVLLGFMIINNTFQGCLTPALSRPSRNPFIDTIDQITIAELALESEHAESLVTDPEMLKLINTLRQRKPTASNFIRLGRFPTTLFHKYYTYLSYRQDKNITENLHTVQECIKSNYLSFVVPRNSPLLRRINKYVVRFQENGLLSKWVSGTPLLLKNIFWPLESDLTVETQPKPLSVIDMTAIFYIHFFGLTIGVVVFVIECLVGNRYVFIHNSFFLSSGNV